NKNSLHLSFNKFYFK
ncbi:unnamed protein product, partial [Brachionus calyciflorus]